MKYKLIPGWKLADTPHESATFEGIEAGLNELAADGWRVVAILDGHIFVLGMEDPVLAVDVPTAAEVEEAKAALARIRALDGS